MFVRHDRRQRMSIQHATREASVTEARIWPHSDANTEHLEMRKCESVC